MVFGSFPEVNDGLRSAIKDERTVPTLLQAHIESLQAPVGVRVRLESYRHPPPPL